MLLGTPRADLENLLRMTYENMKLLNTLSNYLGWHWCYKVCVLLGDEHRRTQNKVSRAIDASWASCRMHTMRVMRHTPSKKGRALRRVFRRGSKKGLSRRHLEGRNTPSRVRPISAAIPRKLLMLTTKPPNFVIGRRTHNR